MNKEDYFKYYIQGSDHYLIPKDVFKELFDEMENWKEEAKELKQKYLNAVSDYETTMAEKNELKKQLEEYQKELEKADSITQSCIFNGKEESKISFRKCLNMLEKHKNQQKEFIEWLEAMSKMYENEYKDIDIAGHYNCVLSKYKEIIGGKE